jgi:hypothetical protein
MQHFHIVTVDKDSEFATQCSNIKYRKFLYTMKEHAGTY